MTRCQQSREGHAAAAQPRCRRRAARDGLSLLEVLLSIVILAASMSLLGELLRMGGQHATSAVELTRSQMYCESLLAEVTVGTLPAQSVSEAIIPTDPEYQYSIDVQQRELEGLISVTVTVQSVNDTTWNPRRARLTRWMIDPELDLTEQAEEQETQAQNQI